MKFEIEPREWEKGKILKIIYPDEKEGKKRLEPSLHFPMIMNYIKKDAVEKYDFDIGPYYQGHKTRNSVYRVRTRDHNKPANCD